MKMTRSITTFALALTLVVFANTAYGQDRPAIRIAPVVDSLTYTRLYDYSQQAGAPAHYSRHSTTLAKGVEATFLGSSGNLATLFRISGGALAEPTLQYLQPDGSRETEPFNDASNSTSSFFGQSRRIEIEEEFTHGQMSYRAGVDLRLVQLGDRTTPKPGAILTPDVAQTNSQYVAPTIAAEWHPTYGRVTLHVEGEAAPWVYYHETSTDHQEGLTATSYEDSARAAGFGADIGASYTLVRNRLAIRGGWRVSEIRAPQSNIAFPGIPHDVPQHDRWQGVYVALEIAR